MENSYQPTTAEIIKEAGSSFVHSSFLKGLKEFGRGLATSAVLFPYALPSFIRAGIISDFEGRSSLTTLEKIGAMAGSLPFFTQFIIYCELSGEHKEILYFPLATNLASFTYEIGRGIYKNAQNKLIERRSKTTLEEKFNR